MKRLALKRKNGIASVTVPGKQVQQTQKNLERKAALAKKMLQAKKEVLPEYGIESESDK